MTKMAKARKPKTTKKRECLKCGKLFASAGNWNRICPKCKGQNARINMPPEAFSETRRGRLVDHRGPRD